jgi:hypothetical protein
MRTLFSPDDGGGDGTTPTPTPVPEATSETPPADAPKTFDAAYVEKLRKENAEARIKAKRADELEAKVKAYEDEQKTEAEKAAERLADYEKRAEKAELALLRRQAADAAGLAPEFADRLTGTTAEELAEDAKSFSELVKGNRPDPKPTDGLPDDFQRGAKKTSDSLSPDEAKRLARENPTEFNRRFEAGQIPASALGA